MSDGKWSRSPRSDNVRGIMCPSRDNMWRYSSENVLCTRELSITNAPYPEHNDSQHHAAQSPVSRSHIMDTGRLLCRWKIDIEPDLKFGSISSFTAAECTPGSTHPSRPSAQGTFTSDHKYTYGDSFCGAGGTAQSARLAGLKIEWGFDQNLTAMQTFRNSLGRSL